MKQQILRAIVIVLLRVAPLKWLYGFAANTALRASNTNRKKSRQQMSAVTEHLFPDLDQSEREEKIDRNWKFVGETMMKVGTIRRETQRRGVQIFGLEEIAKRHKDQRPSIVACVHLGLWEISATCLAQAEILPIAIYQPRSNRLNDFIARRERIKAMMAQHPNPTSQLAHLYSSRLIEGSPKVTRQILQGLKEGQTLWIGVDECVNAHVHGPWFGKNWLKRGNIEAASRLAKHTDAAIFPTWCLETKDGYEITYSEPIEPKGKSLDDIALELASSLRPIVEKNHEQWFMLHELRQKDFQ